jgi:chromosome segregation ATPase
VCADKKATLEEVVDQHTAQLSECEAENKESKAVIIKSQHEQEVMREELDRKNRERDQFSQQLSDAEDHKRTCTQHLADCNSKLQGRLRMEQQQQPVRHKQYPQAPVVADAGAQGYRAPMGA